MTVHKLSCVTEVLDRRVYYKLKDNTLLDYNSKDINIIVPWMVRQGFRVECSVPFHLLQKYSTFFKPSCAVHDALYRTGGTAIQRRKADYGFFKRCVGGSFCLHNDVFVSYVIFAMVFFFAVRLFGWIPFHKGKPRTIGELLILYNTNN